jgi:crossover junction endodeoxyribonuclease RuvC
MSCANRCCPSRQFYNLLPAAPAPWHDARVKVIGIDCGGECTGFGVVEQIADGRLLCHASGGIALRVRDPLPTRLRHIYRELSAVIERHAPDVAAIEDVFNAVNAKSALKLGHVRGVALLVAATYELPVAEYAPLSVKSAVVGYGRADKYQVQQMVTRLLNLPVPPEPFDAADALAIAICHLHTSATALRQSAGR